ncbi:MAG TPA: phosphoribosyltransferase [Coleofasciculaceae cyanobacterium]|jgi:putative phosphoribosyl transferase
MHFEDRTDAGKQLAKALKGYRTENMIVLALPRGGVPVGYEVAQALNVPLDVLVVRKLGVPGQDELAMGAIGPGGVVVLNEEVIRMLQIPPETIDRIIAKQYTEIERRLQSFRGDRPFPNLNGKTVVIVDDGLATGSTALAAVQTVLTQNPTKVILAVPVCAPESAARLRPSINDLICLEQPPDFMAVGYWYRDFRQTTDTEVTELLNNLWQSEQACTPHTQSDR